MSDTVADLTVQTELDRRRFLRYVSLLGAGATLACVPFHFAFRLYGAATVSTVYILVCLIVFAGMRRSATRMKPFAAAYIGATLLTVLGTIHYQNSDWVIDPWILSAPVAAFVLCGRGEAAAWAVATIVLRVATNPFNVEPSTFGALASLALAITAISIGLFFFSMQIENNERAIIDMGNKDSLTGMLNRRSFAETLEGELRRNLRQQSSMTVFMIDVDHFKAYNDRYGHVNGDGILVRIADALKQTARRSGDFVFRYGGEEFCILSPALDRTQAAAFAEALRANVEALALKHDASPLGMVTVSVGFRHADVLAKLTPDLFVEEADKALYLAKANGRNCVASYTDATVNA